MPNPKLITSNQFVTGVLSALTLGGIKQLRLVGSRTDEMFANAYGDLVSQMSITGVVARLLLGRPDHFHGNSETLRETLYAARQKGIVSINNPSFKTIEIELTNDEADEYLSQLPLPAEYFFELQRSTSRQESFRVDEETAQQVTLLTKIKDFVERKTEQQLEEYIAHVSSPDCTFAPKEINDALSGHRRLSPLEAAILDSPILQRLRFIRQLGVVHWVYPGAVHTRFEHTLGVLNRVQELLASLNRSIQEERVEHSISSHLSGVLRLCALLHDVGHGVFSHVSESALDRFDDVRTALVEFAHLSSLENPKLSEIIAAYVVQSPSFNRLLEVLLSKLSHPIQLPDHTAISADHLVRLITSAILGAPIDDRIPLLHELISGPFDATNSIISFVTRPSLGNSYRLGHLPIHSKDHGSSRYPTQPPTNNLIKSRKEDIPPTFFLG